jgi:hypothetical protein
VIATSDSNSRHLLPPSGDVIATYLATANYAPLLSPNFNEISVSTSWGGQIRFINVEGYTDHLKLNAYQSNNHYKMDFHLKGAVTMQIGNDNGYQYLRVNGTVVHSSDNRLKHNEIQIENPCDIISQLNPLFYDRTSEFYAADYNGPVEGSKDCGFIAQEVEMIPELKPFVTIPTDETTPYAVNYQALFTVHVAATQQILKRNNLQDQLIASLVKRLDALEGSKN